MSRRRRAPPPPLVLAALAAAAMAFLGLAAPAYAQGVYGDNRCYLENGGSAESFFVREDLPVGAVVGTLRVIGNPSERGDISLRLQERDSPAAIVPGTKNISLTKRLDKEGIDGPSSVFINVICDRKRASDPGFVIPVNIRVTDANDNAPQFLNAPYVLNISEVTVVGTRVLQGVKAVDADQQGPYSTVHYSVLPGPHSDYFVFVNGLEGTLLLRKPLDYETLSNFTIQIRAQDQGSPPQFSDTTLHVNVMDADDQNPRFVDEGYVATLPEPPVKGARLRVRPRDIAAYDQDAGIRAPVVYAFNSLGGDYRFFEIDRHTGAVALRRSVPDDELPQPATLVVRATQADNPDRYALATLTVSRVGAGAGGGAGAYVAGGPAPPPRFLQRVFAVSALESLPPGSLLLTALTNRPRDKRVRFWLDDPVASEMFAVSSGGDVTLRQPLDFEAQAAFAFALHVGDGRANDTARVEVRVLDVNDWDPRFRYPQYEFFVEAAHPRPGALVGRVEAADGDRSDAVRLSLRGTDARLFAVSDAGEITLQGDVHDLNGSAAHLVAVATDSGVPPREASVPVIVHFPAALGAGGGAAVVGAGAGGAARGWPGAAAAPPGPTLLAVFGALLGLLALIVLLLLLYIYKHKRRKGRGAKPFLAAADPQKAAADAKVDNPIFGGGPAPPASDEAPTYTATVKSIMARTAAGRNGGGVQGKAPVVTPADAAAATTGAAPAVGAGGGGGGKHKVAPAPPQLPSSASGASAEGAGGGSDASTASSAVSETHDQEHDQGHGQGWPPGSIPRRVKKLSWDDEASSGAGSPQPHRHPPKTELDPALSVTPLGGEEGAGDQANLTVYF